MRSALTENGIGYQEMYADIGIVKIDRENIANSQVLLQAQMHTSCFYPFVQYYQDGELAMSYTVARQHIRLAHFTLSKYL